MAKVSRPVIYTALAAVAAYALFLNTQPQTPTLTKRVRVSRTLPAANASGILPEDLKARFPRYAGGRRDPFVPGVALARRTLPEATAMNAQTGWTLTGISAVNGTASALIENPATGESVFLQPGDRWNGLRVVSIRPDRVLFLNGLGRHDALTFAAPPEDKTGGVSVPSAPSLPGRTASLSPYPVAPLQIAPFAGRGGAAVPVLPPLSGTAPAPDFGAPPPDDNGGPPPD